MVGVLFVDMNSYFASCEQELQPRLRGKPVGIIATDTVYTCCIAASYEAKAFGVKTGTGVLEAREKCPSIQFIVARPEVYVGLHHRIHTAVESCAHVDAVLSIDEMACKLIGPERHVENATAIAAKIKATIKKDVGSTLRCSIGLAPNRVLAKVASDMQKPDGLTVITPADLPQKLYPLKLDDLPGVGPRMLERLNKAGIMTMEQLCAAKENALHGVWESVLGRRWYYWLRGEELKMPPTHHRTVGHSHVLPPDYRTDKGAKEVGVHLLHKAAARLRAMRYWAGSLSVSLEFQGDDPPWGAKARLGCVQDTLTMIEVYDRLWARRSPGRPMLVSVCLFDLVPPASATLPLFPEAQNRVKLAHAMDKINTRNGKHSVYFGDMFGALDEAPTRIPFNLIPDFNLPV